MFCCNFFNNQNSFFSFVTVTCKKLYLKSRADFYKSEINCSQNCATNKNCNKTLGLAGNKWLGRGVFFHNCLLLFYSNCPTLKLFSVTKLHAYLFLFRDNQHGNCWYSIYFFEMIKNLGNITAWALLKKRQKIDKT